MYIIYAKLFISGLLNGIYIGRKLKNEKRFHRISDNSEQQQRETQE